MNNCKKNSYNNANPKHVLPSIQIDEPVMTFRAIWSGIWLYKKHLLSFVLLFIIVVLFLLVVPIVVESFSNDTRLKGYLRSLSKLGPVSDYVGGILNPFVAAIAFAGLLTSLMVQRETLRISNQGFNESKEAARRQQDQDNFFSLLSNREAAIQGLTLSFKDSHVSLQGRAVVREILNYLSERSVALSENQELPMGSSVVDMLERTRKQLLTPERLKISVSEFLRIKEFQLQEEAEQRLTLFTLLYSGEYKRDNENNSNLLAEELKIFSEKYGVDSIEDLLGHIFRSTYQVLKFVFHSNFDQEKKFDLINYLRAQMSEAEFIAFGLAALTVIGEKSRAAAIAFDFYENRLLSSKWAKTMVRYFDPEEVDNRWLANSLGYPVLKEYK